MMRRGKKLSFGPEAQTEKVHASEVTRLRNTPPSDAFGASLPQNLRPGSDANLAPDPCHKDSDRVDVDGLTKVGVAVWPSQIYCSMVCSSNILMLPLYCFWRSYVLLSICDVYMCKRPHKVQSVVTLLKLSLVCSWMKARTRSPRAST